MSTNVFGLDDGSGWQDHFESDEVLRALAEKIGEQQRRVAASAPGLHGQVDRGQHQKRLLAARGTLRLSDQVPPALQRGPFATPFELPVACRFSNGQPCPFSDHAADVRGVALKFFSPLGAESDLLMTNQGGRSHARDAQEFMAFADLLVARIEGGTGAALKELREELHDHKLSIPELMRMAGSLFKETTLHKVTSLTTEHYWGSVLRLGDAAFKHSLHPHPGTPRQSQAVDLGDNYLRDDLMNRLARGPVRWRLCVQLFIDEQTTPVGDASVAWGGELIEIGELELSGLPSPSDEVQIDRFAFNPTNGFAALGITHARREVYAASARNRAERGLASSEEARRFIVTGS